MSSLSGWCSAPPSIRPKHEGCRWDLCSCFCHREGVTKVEFRPLTCDNGHTTKDGPEVAALTATESRGLARRYRGAPN